MIEFIYDTQMLLEGQGLPEDGIRAYITDNIPGDSLLVVGTDEMLRIHFHTNVPWKVMAYIAQFGPLHDIVIENMQDQSENFSPDE